MRPLFGCYDALALYLSFWPDKQKNYQQTVANILYAYLNALVTNSTSYSVQNGITIRI